MELTIRFPEDFPLHGFDRDAFEVKLRTALCSTFDGRRVQQLADQVDAHRAISPSGLLPLRSIGDELAFEECMTLDLCPLDRMSTALRKMILNAIATRLGIELTERGMLLGPVREEGDFANRVVPDVPPVGNRKRSVGIGLGIAMALGLVAAGTEWEVARTAPAPMVATVVSTSPAKTLRELASSVPDDQQPYRISVQVEPQTASTGSR
ncbi:hypothetical protein [Trinickia symbiotica]|uniref:hypothetical protein n=1 Tax=Trinickia symbiotica TaxID=863227 RepID=UPI00131BFAF9|nr:hypothetical protein [Trinickia symbiotica]